MYSYVYRLFCYSGIFEELSLSNAQEQLIVSFLNSPSLHYANGALSKLSCYELKLVNTNPQIPIDFFYQAISIHHVIIDNPSFSGFMSSSNPKSSFTIQIYKLSIKDISIRRLQGKHFPIIFNSVYELSLENYKVNGGFRSFNTHELAQCFPKLRSLKLFSRSIQRVVSRMFENFSHLEYLTLNGITTVEHNAFNNLYHLKELNLGKNILNIEPYAFIHMHTDMLILNESMNFQLNDDKNFCAFVPFSPLTNLKTFVQFAKNSSVCSCTLRYLYRHLDKSFMTLAPYCYLDSSLYILSQEERLCHFEKRLLECDILPDEGITIYGKHYNVSHFYDQQISKRRYQLSQLFRYRNYIIALFPILAISLCLIIRHKIDHHHNNKHKYLNRLLKQQKMSRNETFDMIYHHSNDNIDPVSSRTYLATSV